MVCPVCAQYIRVRPPFIPFGGVASRQQQSMQQREGANATGNSSRACSRRSVPRMISCYLVFITMIPLCSSNTRAVCLCINNVE